MKTVLLLLLGHLVLGANSYNVLFMLPFASKSHKNVFNPVAEELGKRGHQVTLFSPFEENETPPGVHNVVGLELEAAFDRSNFSYFSGAFGSSATLKHLFELINYITELAITDPFIAGIIKEPIHPLVRKPKFDVVVIDAVFNDFAMALGHHMGVPNILFSPATAYIHHSWNLNVPYPLSYVPSGTSDVPEPMGFIDRALSTISNLGFIYFMNLKLFPKLDLIIKKYLTNVPPLIELNRNVSFMLSNSHPAVHFRKPGMPFTAEVSGINIQPIKQLTKNLDDFAQQAGKFGVIYFSLGSYTKGESMPLEMRNKIIEVFRKLPQKFIWKFEKNIPNLPSNIKLVKWAPQQDILAHPQTRLFITHGGGLSVSEAAYHGCPILAFPLSADQLGNVAQAKRLSFGDYLDWKTFTSEDLLESIKRILEDRSYKEKAMLASVLMKDRPQNPVETAAYWIEYVVRHNGAPFLKPSADHLNFFQYFLLDIIVAAIGIFIVSLFALFYIVKFGFRLLSAICNNSASRKANKQKHN